MPTPTPSRRSLGCPQSEAAETLWKSIRSLRSICHPAAAQPGERIHVRAPGSLHCVACKEDRLTAPLHEEQNVFSHT
jgi:hypothetical protein